MRIWLQNFIDSLKEGKTLGFYRMIHIMTMFPISIFFIQYFIVYPNGKTTLIGSVFYTMFCFVFLLIVILTINMLERNKEWCLRYPYSSRVIGALGISFGVSLFGCVIPVVSGGFLGIHLSYISIYFICISAFVGGMTGIFAIRDFSEESIESLEYFKNLYQEHFQTLYIGALMIVAILFLSYVAIYFQIKVPQIGVFSVFIGFECAITFVIIPFWNLSAIRHRILTLENAHVG